MVVAAHDAHADELKRNEIKDEFSQLKCDRVRPGLVPLRERVREPRARPDWAKGARSPVYRSARRPPRSREDGPARPVGKGVCTAAGSESRSRGTRAQRRAAGFAESRDLREVDHASRSPGSHGDREGTRGYDATPPRHYHSKLAEQFASWVPAVVLLFAVAGPPFPGPAQTLLVSGLVGVVYILFSGVAASLGYGGAGRPAIGGWGPVLLFGSVAALLGLRLWRRR